MGDVERLPDVMAREALLLTPEEAATLLRVGGTTVYALMKAGELRPVHIGRGCRISHAELERFVGQLGCAVGSSSFALTAADLDGSGRPVRLGRDLAGRGMSPQTSCPCQNAPRD